MRKTHATVLFYRLDKLINWFRKMKPAYIKCINTYLSDFNSHAFHRLSGVQ